MANAHDLHTFYARKTFLLSLTRVYQVTAQVNVKHLVFHHGKLIFLLIWRKIRRLTVAQLCVTLMSLWLFYRLEWTFPIELSKSFVSYFVKDKRVRSDNFRFRVLSPWRELAMTWNGIDFNCGNTDEMEMWSSQL